MTAGGALLGCGGLAVSAGRAREGLGQRAGWPGWLCLQGSAGGPGPGGSRAQPPALAMSEKVTLGEGPGFSTQMLRFSEGRKLLPRTHVRGPQPSHLLVPKAP